MPRPQTIRTLLWRLLRAYWQRSNKQRLVVVGLVTTLALAVMVVLWRSSDAHTAGTSNASALAIGPQLDCPDVRPLLTTLEAAQAQHYDTYEAADLVAIHDALDELALAVLCGAPPNESTALETLFRGFPQVDRYQLDIRGLRPGELLLLWAGTGGSAGGRASVFRRESSGWQRVGGIDFAVVWSPYPCTIQANGVVTVHAISMGNGAPPSRLVALAVDGDQILIHDSGPVASVACEGLDSEPGLTISRRTKHYYQYPNMPLLHYAVGLRPYDHRLVASERLLTPWAQALDDFCGGDSSVAVPGLLAPSEEAGQHPGQITSLYCYGADAPRIARNIVEIDLELEIDWQSRRATLTIKRIDGRWRIVAVE